MQEQTKSEKEEPCVRVFFPYVSEPYLYVPNSDTEFVKNELGTFHHCIGQLRKRGSKLGVGTKTLEAGDYDFHITEQTPPQQGK
jgi:hypothetical protein